jgi:hypothetical protein
MYSSNQQTITPDQIRAVTAIVFNPFAKTARPYRG